MTRLPLPPGVLPPGTVRVPAAGTARPPARGGPGRTAAGGPARHLARALLGGLCLLVLAGCTPRAERHEMVSRFRTGPLSPVAVTLAPETVAVVYLPRGLPIDAAQAVAEAVGRRIGPEADGPDMFAARRIFGLEADLVTGPVPVLRWRVNDEEGGALGGFETPLPEGRPVSELTMEDLPGLGGTVADAFLALAPVGALLRPAPVVERAVVPPPAPPSWPFAPLTRALAPPPGEDALPLLPGPAGAALAPGETEAAAPRVVPFAPAPAPLRMAAPPSRRSG